VTALCAVFIAVCVSIVTVAVIVAIVMVMVVAAILAAGYILLNLCNHVRYFAGFGYSAEHDAKN
jgi:hypothetical protein